MVHTKQIHMRTTLRPYTPIYNLRVLGHSTLLHRPDYTISQILYLDTSIQLFENSFYTHHPKPPPTNTLPVQKLLQILLYLIQMVRFGFPLKRMPNKAWASLRPSKKIAQNCIDHVAETPLPELQPFWTVVTTPLRWRPGYCGPEA